MRGYNLTEIKKEGAAANQADILKSLGLGIMLLLQIL